MPTSERRLVMDNDLEGWELDDEEARNYEYPATLERFARTVYTERVEAGMAWLDAHRPGWERKVDLGTLRLAEGCNCILGQVLRDEAAAVNFRLSGWCYGLRYLPQDATVLGFSARQTLEWEPLEAEWRAAIKRRFDTGVLSDDVAGRGA